MSKRVVLSDSLRAINLVANHHRFTPKLVRVGLSEDVSLERVERLLSLLERRGFLKDLGLRVPLYWATTKGRLAVAGAKLLRGAKRER